MDCALIGVLFVCSVDLYLQILYGAMYFIIVYIHFIPQIIIYIYLKSIFDYIMQILPKYNVHKFIMV